MKRCCKLISCNLTRLVLCRSYTDLEGFMPHVLVNQETPGPFSVLTVTELLVNYHSDIVSINLSRFEFFKPACLNKDDTFIRV